MGCLSFFLSFASGLSKLFKARKKYYYDEEACAFLPYRPDSKEKVRNIFVRGALMLCTGLVITFLLFRIFEHPFEKLLRNRQELLLAEAIELRQETLKKGEELLRLYKHDSQIYAAVLGVEPLKDGLWTSGTGGSEALDGLNDNVILQLSVEMNRMLTQTALLNGRFARFTRLTEAKKIEMAHLPAIKPVNGAIMSGFGMRLHPIFHSYKFHTGIDFDVDQGTPVYATGNGVVRLASNEGDGYGNQIEIDHKIGFVSKYAHLSRISVSYGQKVKRGQLIGYSGNTGQSTGPHLHYEVIHQGSKTDPIDFFYSDVTPQEYRNYKSQSEEPGYSSLD